MGQGARDWFQCLVLLYGESIYRRMGIISLVHAIAVSHSEITSRELILMLSNIDGGMDINHYSIKTWLEYKNHLF